MKLKFFITRGPHLKAIYNSCILRIKASYLETYLSCTAILCLSQGILHAWAMENLESHGILESRGISRAQTNMNPVSGKRLNLSTL